MHPAQNNVRSRLQRRVNVLRNARRGGHQTQQIVREIHWLDRTQPNPLDRSFIQQAAQQIRKTHPAARFPSPAPQIDAGENYLPVIRGDRAHLRHNFIRAHVAALAAHEGNHAKGAAVVAPILNLEVGT